MIGGRNLVSSRVKEIVDSLEEIKQERGFDYVFLNLIELENYFNILVASDNNTKNLLEKTLGVKFSTDWTEREQLIMRKQIVPLLKEELDNE
jgi:inorganic pyrophosphatase/exopolyphosphatase